MTEYLFGIINEHTAAPLGLMTGVLISFLLLPIINKILDEDDEQ